MTDDKLRQLVREADRRVDPCGAPRATPETLLQAARRSRASKVRWRGAAAIAVVGLAASSFVQWRIGDQATAPNRAEPLARSGPNSNADWSLKRPVRSADAVRTEGAPAAEELRQELARLEREAQMHQEIVAALLAPDEDELEAELAAVLHGPSGLRGAELLRQETARSAAISLQYATIVEKEFQDSKAAQREYERVARRFPGTRWAKLAATSLRRLSTPSDPFSL